MTHVEIPLSRGLFARVSPEDSSLAQFRWHAVKAGHTYYAARRTPDKTVYMHRAILGLVGEGRDVVVDHINHDGLDNTRQNIRRCTQAQNTRNLRSRKPRLARVGVSFNGSAWLARIRHMGRSIHLGSYATEHEAGIAYDAALKVLESL